MARAGLYKGDVQKARDALLAQGKKPSVDAVRVALGRNAHPRSLFSSGAEKISYRLLTLEGFGAKFHPKLV